MSSTARRASSASTRPRPRSDTPMPQTSTDERCSVPRVRPDGGPMAPRGVPQAGRRAADQGSVHMGGPALLLRRHTAPVPPGPHRRRLSTRAAVHTANGCHDSALAAASTVRQHLLLRPPRMSCHGRTFLFYFIYFFFISTGGLGGWSRCGSHNVGRQAVAHSSGPSGCGVSSACVAMLAVVTVLRWWVGRAWVSGCELGLLASFAVLPALPA